MIVRIKVKGYLPKGREKNTDATNRTGRILFLALIKDII
jgi:hypothetical protein